MAKIIVIGGGAAGMAAALTAAKARPGVSVTILERMDRVGKKILATGNGRCNLTNEDVSPAHYYGNDKGLLRKALYAMPVEQVLDFFGEYDLLCQTEDEGRVYPYCKQASMVLDVLLIALERANIDVQCGCAVEEIVRNKGEFRVKTADGRSFSAQKVIVTCGGKAAPKLGSDGSGFRLVQQLGHSFTPLYPALTAMKCDMNGLGGLKGIRANGTLRLMSGTQLLGEDTGEIQFTEYGLSGIPAMQLSGRLSRLRNGEKCTALVDLFPEWERDALFHQLKMRQKAHPKETLENFLLGTVHKRLAFAVLKSAGLQPLSRENGSLTGKELSALTDTLKNWRFTVTGTQGWDAAQVTGGGVPLKEVDVESMQSLKTPGLYLAGEILDVVGDCGGFNLHWAWCSGMRAGQSAAEEVRP